jgi:hypothetical protein
MVNVRYERCAELNCQTIASFNFPPCLTGLYCFNHKRTEWLMLDMKDALN